MGFDGPGPRIQELTQQRPKSRNSKHLVRSRRNSQDSLTWMSTLLDIPRPKLSTLKISLNDPGRDEPMNLEIAQSKLNPKSNLRQPEPCYIR